MKNAKTITVVGGGTAGLVVALILKKYLAIDITVIQSSKIGIIGVGEGSTEHWSEFMSFMEFNYKELIQQCDATCKSGIMFKNWTEQDYLHNVNTDYGVQHAQYSYFFARQIAHGLPQVSMVNQQHFDSEVNTWFVDQDQAPTFQYHFNTHKLNQYLIKQCQRLDIHIVDDEISDVVLNDQGEIDTLIGTKQRYHSDFYIDSTGFKRILMNRLGAKWTSYGQYLRMKSALVFPTEDTDHYPMWTLSQAMDAGWLFRIPTYGRYGNGYIFDSDYITQDQAKQEIDALYGRDIEIGKRIDFDPGCLDRVWIKNCCAVGLSASFVEPLEASSIGTSIQQAFLLMHKLSNYTQQSIDSYNQDVNDILLNIRDFVALHYVTKKNSSNFWIDQQHQPLPDRLKQRLEVWRHRLPIREDFNRESRYILFTERHHILVAHGLGLFDQASIANEYHSHSSAMQAHADEINVNREFFNATVQTMPHKQYLTKIKSLVANQELL